MLMKTLRQSELKNQLNNLQTFSQHLLELRTRAVWYVTFLVLCSFVGYLFRNQILQLLLKPLNQPVFYTSPTGGFDLVLKISLFSGLTLSTPVLVYHIIRFIEPVLPHPVPKLMAKILILSTLLLIIGMSFAYYISLPAALYFLGSFAGGEVKSLISSNDYFTFATRYIIGFGLVFQLPLFVVAINSVKKLSAGSLFMFQRWFIIISFIIAAIITPTPDFLNQLIMALPLILLYQISVIYIWFINKGKN